MLSLLSELLFVRSMLLLLDIDWVVLVLVSGGWLGVGVGLFDGVVVGVVVGLGVVFGDGLMFGVGLVLLVGVGLGEVLVCGVVVGVGLFFGRIVICMLLWSKVLLLLVIVKCSVICVCMEMLGAMNVGEVCCVSLN